MTAAPSVCGTPQHPTTCQTTGPSRQGPSKNRQAVRPGPEQDLTQPQPPRCALLAPAQQLLYLPLVYLTLAHFPSFPWSIFVVMLSGRGIFLLTEKQISGMNVRINRQ